MHTALENLIHGLDCSWFDAETGSVDELGWFARIDGPITADMIPDHLKEEWDELADDDRDELATMAGVILNETSQGFRYVTGYRDAAAIQAAWDAIEAEYAEFYAERDEIESGDDETPDGWDHV